MPDFWESAAGLSQPAMPLQGCVSIVARRMAGHETVNIPCLAWLVALR